MKYVLEYNSHVFYMYLLVYNTICMNIIYRLCQKQVGDTDLKALFCNFMHYSFYLLRM